MARSKNATPIRRTPSETYKQSNGSHHELNGMVEKVEHALEDRAEQHARDPKEQKEAGLLALVVCVGGIYASFLTWGYLQEGLTTTGHGPDNARFTYPVFLNTVQSIFAAISGSIYLALSAPRDPKTGARNVPPIFPSKQILAPLLLIAITSSLASPFGYASLKHIDYVTFILAKSCKLLPVMFLHITLFQKRYPLYKYMVISCVTLGVAVFTLHNPSTAKKAAKKSATSNSSSDDTNKLLGLFLLAINLLFDGLTNTFQDQIFTTFKSRFSGPQMMCAQNIISTLLTSSYLVLTPYLATLLPASLASYISSSSDANELSSALAFVSTYPSAGLYVLGFSAAGAIGQVFIFHTLAHFDSLLLVTVTVTRKMLTMLMSVVLYGHRITGMQWAGVGLVFGGIGAEAWVSRGEKLEREREKRRVEREGKGGKGE